MLHVYDSYCGSGISVYTECVFMLSLEWNTECVFMLNHGMEYCMCMTVTVVVGFLHTVNVCLC